MASVPGSYVFADWVAPECLRIMKNSMEALAFANYDYDAEFDRDFAIGDTVRVKYPQMFSVTDGQDYTPQAIDRRFTTVTMDQWLQIGFQWDSLEKALKLERSQSEISKQYLQPAMAKLVQEAESRFMLYAFLNTNNVTGVLGTTPTSWAAYAAADTRLVENAGLEGAQANIVSPQMMETMISNSLLQFNPPDAISSQYKKNMVGTAAGAEWYRSMSCRAFTTGVWATVLTGVTINAAGQSGSSITVACTTGDTFLAGDIISIASCYNVNPWTGQSTGRLKNFKIMASTTGAASTATLTISPAIIGPGSPYQNVSALPANSDAVLQWPGTTFTNGAAKSGVLGIRLNKMAFAAVNCELPMPKQGGTIEIASQMTDPDTKISIALVRAFDPVGRKWINRFDTLFGFGSLYPDRAACLIASLV
jgi:P22 coat protein - gene protein 5